MRAAALVSRDEVELVLGDILSSITMMLVMSEISGSLL